MTKQLETLETKKYLPLPLGGLRISLMIGSPILMYLVSGAAFYGLFFGQSPEDLYKVQQFLAGMVGIVTIMMFARINGELRLLRFLALYWQRNVRGHFLYCIKYHNDLYYGIAYRSWNPMFDLAALAVGVPLGGWNHHVGICGSGVLAVSDKADEHFLTRWHLRLAGFDKYSVHVRLTDHVGDRVTLPIETVIQIFEKFIGIEGMVYSRFELMTRHLLLESDRMKEAFYKKALPVIADASRSIASTTRFIRSKDAQNIRSWLDEQRKALVEEYGDSAPKALEKPKK